jgi:hypothetical protein
MRSALCEKEVGKPSASLVAVLRTPLRRRSTRVAGKGLHRRGSLNEIAFYRTAFTARLALESTPAPIQLKVTCLKGSSMITWAETG